jgi:exosortase
MTQGLVASRSRLSLGPHWPLVIGFAALAIPTALLLAGQTWTEEQGEQGPILLATGAWLLWRQLPALRQEAKPGAPLITGLILAIALPAYVLGRMLDFLTIEAAGVWGAGLAILHDRFGRRALAKAWFPLLYLAFVIPPPSFVIDELTAPLKRLAALVSTNSLAAVGVPVSRQGVIIFVAQYQLLVENACSGMNSLIGLTAIGLLYVYLMRRASPLYAFTLTLLVIPIAILANILRIMALILITYAFGDEVGQSFIHYAAGLFLFGMALLLVFAVDGMLQATLFRSKPRP